MSDTFNPAREGDLDRNASDTLDAAETVLEQFCSPETLSPRFAVDPDQIIARYSEANRVPTGQALALYQSGLKSLCTGERTRFDNGRVSLDLDGLAEGRTWSVPGPVTASDEKGNDFTDYEYVVPQIVFCALSLDSTMFVAGECEAIAVHYLPSTKVVTKIRQRDGVPYQVSDDYAEAGYLGVAATFSSVAEAKDARDELVEAVRAYGRESRSAREPDVFEREAAKAAAPSVPAII